ncbi:hypothetical protein [Vibrio parahaemolyticus]|uniref:hypothetical protein n=1 Tax=Vibrio parahaemolyticus TaxID=670 RepID=UPI00111FF228|nr:hypothetical protein [Vibrio parahaemolyticus]TOG86222.1 hypothetical protein CGI92_24975 [Vibrio parahaemolyticus]
MKLKIAPVDTVILLVILSANALCNPLDNHKDLDDTAANNDSTIIDMKEGNSDVFKYLPSLNKLDINDKSDDDIINFIKNKHQWEIKYVRRD